MSDHKFPAPLQAMLDSAKETHKSGNIERAETEYLLAVDYSSKLYQAESARTGLVLLELAEFYEATNQKDKAAIALARSNAIVFAYQK